MARVKRPWLVPLLAALLAVALVLLLGVVPPHEIPSYRLFGRIAVRPVAPGVLIAVVFAALFWVVSKVRAPWASWKKLTLFLVLGVGLQWAFFFSEGRGVGPMASRIWDVGHTEFIRIAQRGPLPPDLVERYEEIAKEQRWEFPRTKGPGVLYLYRALVALGEGAVGAALRPAYFPRVQPPDERERAKQRISATCFFLFPLFTFLTVFPLFFLGRDLVGERAAVLAALLYVVAPSVILVVMHTDGAVYPLLGACAAALVVAGVRRGKAWAVAAGGGVLSLALFVSFSLLPLVPLLLGWLGWEALFSDESRPRAARLRRGLWHLALFGLGLALPHLFFVLVWGYRPLARFLDSIEFHRTWRWYGHSMTIWRFLNPIQFAVWFGLPLTVLLFAEAGHRARRWRTPLAGWLALCLLGIFGCNYFAKSEVMRLWIFWMPLLTVGPAAWLERWTEEGRRDLVPYVVALQLAGTFAIHATFAP